MSSVRYTIDESMSFVPMFDVLWTNPNPGASFAEQTIRIDSNMDNKKYNLFIIVTCDNSGSSTRIANSVVMYEPRLGSSDLNFTGNLTRVSVVDNKIFNRDFAVSVVADTSGGVTIYFTFEFLNATSRTIGSTTNTVVNTNCVPYAILGTKI